jgi:hypothetical protein
MAPSIPAAMIKARQTFVPFKKIKDPTRKRYELTKK